MNYRFIDENKIAVTGVSYGGYLSSLMLAERHDDNMLACGVAVSPVVDWKFYGKHPLDLFCSLIKWSIFFTLLSNHYIFQNLRILKNTWACHYQVKTFEVTKNRA